MHIANDPDPAPTPTYMWRVLREYLGTFFSLFGAPLDIARRVWISRDEARGLGDVLRPLEMMLRRLVFLDALELVVVTAPAPAPAKARVRARRDTYNLETSTSWRASFDLGMDAKRGPRRAPDPHAPKRPRLPNAIFTAPLALRAEALIRGFNHPAPLVQRMARLLARDRARQHKILCDVRACDRAKPFFHEVALAIALAREHFQAWLHKQLNPRPADSS